VTSEGQKDAETLSSAMECHTALDAEKHSRAVWHSFIPEIIGTISRLNTEAPQ
jgi:hypothetical protein